MREDDHGASRYLSPLVKQDLAKLDTDGDTRRIAVNSLKLFVEQLDASTLPRFISQVAESREPGATRSYAILLYEEVARVHGKLVVPYIPKVMAAVIRSSAASGSFPQLQSASARVTAALARHCITSADADSEEVLGALCAPLVDALSGKLEPVAATAAACLHALAETERWKHVSEETVHEVCHRTTVALSEKATRTAAHMQLIRILASVSPDVVSVHGAGLLRAGEDILMANANSWQLRKAAAQLLQSVLTVLDKDTLDTELDSALHALDSCRFDKMPHVRAAVSEALHTAKMLASGTVSSSSWSPRTPLRARASVFNSPRGASVSPTSQESRRFSFSPTSTSASECSAHPPPPARKRGARAKRAPLYPARMLQSPRSSPSSSTTTVEECESPSRRLNVNEFSHVPLVEVDAQLIDLETKQAQADGITQPEPTCATSSGEDLRVDDHVEVVLPRLKMSNAPIDERSTPTLIQDSIITPRDSEEPAHMDVEVEKREVFTEILRTPKAASQSHKANFARFNGSLEFDEVASLSIPKRLVRSLSNLSIPDSGDYQQDVKRISQDDAPTAEADETLSETGWSVRDNPIASEDSYRGESSDEETFKTFPQPASLTASPRTNVPSPTPPQDEMCRLISSGPCKSPSCGLPNPTPIEDDGEEQMCSLISSSGPCKSMQSSSCGLSNPTPPQDDREEQMRRLISSGPCKSMQSPSCGLSSPVPPPDDGEQQMCRLISSGPCKSTLSPRRGLSSLFHHDGSTSRATWEGKDSVESRRRGSERGLVRMVCQSYKYWKMLRCYAKTALGGSLCLVIALPLAMIVAKVVTHGGRECHHLVPT